MKRLLILSVLVFLSSCYTREKCNELFPPSVTEKIVVKDSIVRDTVEVTIPGNTLVLHDTIVDCKDFEKELEDARTKLRIAVRNGRLTASCECKEYKTKIIVDSLIRTITKDRLEMRTAATKKKKWLSFWESWACLGFIALILARFIMKKLGVRLSFSPIPPYISIGMRN